MTTDLKTSFLTYYIHSLAERTRVEKTGTKFGFDWIIYNLGLAVDWTPHRLPFLRGSASEISKTKSENEFGIDLAFLSADKHRVTVFVLKDEVLKSSNWTSHGFDSDLRRAAAPDLSSEEMREVTEVCVVLAYNKDEDQAGIELYDRLTASLGTKVGDNASLRFERWNLTHIVAQVSDHLLSASLLPQSFFSQFSYLCAQFGDFQHGSEEWTRQLIPSWRRFLDDLLKGDPDERAVRLLPVALIILREHGTSNPTAGTGWIDLMEWAVLASWQVHRTTDKQSVRQAIQQMWVNLYLIELEKYYRAQAANLAVEGSLDKHIAGGFVDTVASAVVAHWHVARLGILALALSEILPADTEDQAVKRGDGLGTVAQWMVALIRANPAARRPLLDIHHIELFLVWRALWQIGAEDEIHTWLVDLQNRLLTRRTGKAELPFLEGNNSLEAVFEHVANGERPYEYCDQSSVFLTCLLELACSVPLEGRDALIEAIHRRLVLAHADCGSPIANCEPIDLMLWVPPVDWGDRILTKSLADQGECITVSLFSPFPGSEANDAILFERIARFVEQTRAHRPFDLPEHLPASVIVLACLKHCSPLPPELWRLSIFEHSNDAEVGAEQK
jgi:hypothetical protein